MARYDRPRAVDKIAIDPSRASHSANIVLGMTVMSVAMLAAPAMDIIAKYLGTTGDVTPGIITYIRFLIQAAILMMVMVFLLLTGRVSRVFPRRLGANLLRGAMMAIASFLFFTSVNYMPVADAIAIFFVEPFILTILSALLLGEKVGWPRRFAVLIGFGGALLIIQPSFEALGAVAFLPIATAFIFALYLIITRKISGDDNPVAMQFMAGIGGTVAMAVVLYVGGDLFEIELMAVVWPSASFTWFLVLCIGVLGTISHLMIVYAFARAPASILAPFQYVEIIGATILGYIVFENFPDALKWVGIVIIVGSGIYIFWRETVISRREKQV